MKSGTIGETVHAPGGRPVLLVLTSTFPRWPGDHEPPFVHELSRRLTGFEVHVLAPHAPGAATLEKMDGMTVHRFRYAPRALETLAYDGGIPHKLRTTPWKYLLVGPFLLALGIATWHLIRKLRPDAVHAHWLLPQGLVALAARRLSGRSPRLLVTSHGADVHGLQGSLATRLKRLVIRRADRVSAVSHDMAGRMRGIGLTDREIPVIPMGVDTRNAFVPPAARPRTTDLVFAGRLVEKKGVTYLIEAMAAVHAHNPNVKLVIAGGGPLEINLRQRVGELSLGSVISFTGAYRNDQLPEILGKAAVGIFPFVSGKDGDQEGLGLVMVEAMACGCAVIAGDVPGARDVIRPGENGLLVPSGDASALASAIMDLIADTALRARLAQTGLVDARQQFDLTAVGQRYTRLLDPKAR